MLLLMKDLPRPLPLFAAVLLFSTPEGRAASSLLFGATSLEARSNLSSSSSVSSGDPSHFTCRQLLLINRDPHPLMHRVGGILGQWLETSPLIERVEHLNAPAQTRGNHLALPVGARAPDLFLRLEVDKLHETGWFSRSTKAVLTASLGNAPWQSSHSIIDETTPPLIGLHWNAVLDHQSTLKGFEKVKYRSVADSIAGEFAKSITNQLAKLHTEHGALPAHLYGPYHPAPQFSFLDDVQAKLEFSYYGLLTHNESFWRFQTSDPIPQVESIVQQLRAEGWHLHSEQLTNTSALFIRATRADARLEIFKPREAGLHPGPDALQPEIVEVVLHYREPFSRAQRRAALDRLLSERAPVDTLLLFERSFSTSQRKRFHALLAEKPASSPAAYLSLARMHLEQKDTNQAIEVLTRAKALAVTLQNPSALEAQIGNVARQISPKADLPLPVTAETLRELGFFEITAAAASLVLEKAVDEPLLLFSVADDGRPRTLCLRLRPVPGQGEGQKAAYEWTSLNTHPHGRSSTSSRFEMREAGWTHDFSLDGYQVELRMKPAAEDHRLVYELRVKRTPTPQR